MLLLFLMVLNFMFIFQDREENTLGTADGRLQLDDPILQKQLL